MLSLHQLRCFLTVYELGSLTAAAEELGYAQPSVSEQIRTLERSLDIQLFRRVGRGVVPTTVADTLRPHAEATIAAAEEARRAVQRVKSFETGTIRFGMFGSARLYAGAGLVADVLERYPGVRVEIIGQNSSEVLEDLRRGRIEAALIAAPPTSEGLAVTPVGREELVYVSADPSRTSSPVTARRLAEASARDVRHDLPGHRLDAADAAQDASRGRSQPADADRGRGRRDRHRADGPRAGRHGGPAGRRPGAGAAAGSRGDVDVAATTPVRDVRDRAPRQRHPLPRGRA